MMQTSSITHPAPVSVSQPVLPHRVSPTAVLGSEPHASVTLSRSTRSEGTPALPVPPAPVVQPSFERIEAAISRIIYTQRARYGAAGQDNNSLSHQWATPQDLLDLRSRAALGSQNVGVASSQYVSAIAENLFVTPGAYGEHLTDKTLPAKLAAEFMAELQPYPIRQMSIITELSLAEFYTIEMLPRSVVIDFVGLPRSLVLSAVISD